ncbi:hypothetical protein [Hoyosella subflava]|uniref:Uncharacterized protein n=1 Tax=Hoyosella subflava (strain DSM 45089 / JCM 17490 / NBRC 109087 / DQS3-9A1) TaxID=443218 RepID=F6ENB5_HOYSD|nr:hypothetical protein [Hoyosella subflava]AEF40386.1 hypothetical protein AS9A_1937 [Hoyosella subflava DQS3-9A1]
MAAPEASTGGNLLVRHRIFIGLGAALIVATYLSLVYWRPEGLADATGVPALAALAGNTLGAALLLAGVVHRLPLTTVVLIPSAIAVNIVVGQITSLLGIPLYLDSIGTVLVAALAGPAAGVATGVLGSVVWGLTLAPVAAAFAVVAALIGALAGLLARAGLFRRFYLVPFGGGLTGICAALIAAPIAAFVFGGVTGGGATAVVAALRAVELSLLESTTIQGLLFDPLDKAITFTMVALILAALPLRITQQFTFAARHTLSTAK